MKSFSPSDMKGILYSKRANIYYLEHCRVVVNGGRVEYLTSSGKQSCYWNIPVANTSVILLGTGTSITQAAVRELTRAGVPIGFCGGNGTPLYSASDHELPVLWFQPQSEYRPTEYVQAWLRFWFDEEQRLAVARFFQRKRLDQIGICWTRQRFGDAFRCCENDLQQLVANGKDAVARAASFSDLFLVEARFSKQLYGLACRMTDYGPFTRVKRGMGLDRANRFLDHGNYLAYGLAATAAWVLGIPHAFAVMHGKTRRGGLVFDVADLIKDAVIMPEAFLGAMRGDSEQEFRKACIDVLTRTEALDFMLDTLKEAARSEGVLA
jgi:CRISPR-associated endonuclease Cas1